MRKAHLVVEGHGEQEAAVTLVTKLGADLGLPPITWATPKRVRALNTQTGVLTACKLLRSEQECAFALLLRDVDDGCPAALGPETARWVEEAKLPFAVAVVLAQREFEAWFLPCLPKMAGKELRQGTVIREGAVFIGDPEGVRNAKGEMSRHFPPGRAYKPTSDQNALTKLIDFGMLREAGVRSFGTLENALRFLTGPEAKAGQVYPPAQRLGTSSTRGTPPAI